MLFVSFLLVLLKNLIFFYDTLHRQISSSCTTIAGSRNQSVLRTTSTPSFPRKKEKLKDLCRVAERL